MDKYQAWYKYRIFSRPYFFPSSAKHVITINRHIICMYTHIYTFFLIPSSTSYNNSSSILYIVHISTAEYFAYIPTPHITMSPQCAVHHLTARTDLCTVILGFSFFQYRLPQTNKSHMLSCHSRLSHTSLMVLINC